MKPFSFLILIVYFSHNCIGQDIWDNALDILNLSKDPDTKLNVTDLIKSKGYPAESYTVETKDGYLLTVQRIPSGKAKVQSKSKKVVFLQHGLLSSSTDWVMNFPTQSLGYILADAGYDVWLGNIRGNTYSRRHVKFSPKSKQFWKFSFDEMAKYDLPAMIDFILNFTNQKQLSYIGHSQGTTAAFAMLSQYPEYNTKVNIFIALAPVATVGHMTSAIRYLAPFTFDIDFLFRILGVGEFLPSNAVVKFLSELLCNTKAKFICKDLIFLLCGTDYSQLNQTRLGVYVAHTPAGASAQSIIHFAQMINSKKFQMYDFGKKSNLIHYKQVSPPEYNIKNITTKVALLWSKNDQMADPEDVHLIERNLKSCVSSYCVKFAPFNHLDFVWGINASSLVYVQVQSLLKVYA